MSLTEYAQAVDPVFFVVSIIVILGLSLMVILFILINIMHLILTPRLDPILFNERWFTRAELAMYSAWPLSLIKSGAYMALIGFPKRMLKSKRFKGYDLDLTFKASTVIASRFCIFMALSIIFLGIAFFVIGSFSMIEAEFF